MGKLGKIAIAAIVMVLGGLTAGAVFSVSPALSLVLLVPAAGVALIAKARKAISLNGYRWDIVIMFAIAFICLTIAYLFSTMTPAELRDILVVVFAFLAGLIGGRVANI
jgi:hypothetical protein